MALINGKYKDQPFIYHSDNGLQYCSNEYQALLDRINIRLSMTKENDPYQNAIAERINRVLK
ncbi:MAG: hypothetical protein ABF274_04380 [Nonlabens sp.]|jgi:transposase InsO family protein|uniref:hypothetical protein n=1 Tax=Nonlabens sp. TaxID=1888209 RepID=UPI003219D3A5